MKGDDNMVKNEHGFSLVELLAIIVITTTIIVPLLSSLVDNIEINYRMHNRRSASSVGDATLSAMEELTFADLETLVNDENVASNYYLELNGGTTCDQLSPADQPLCDQIFGQVWNNLSFDDTTFRVFIYDYNLPQAYIDDLTTNTDIPIEVRNYMDTLTTSSDPNPALLRVSVWLLYADDPRGTVLFNGLITDE